ncbi:NPC intracellular cholesterol transporter 1 [Phytophthora pseudosyringae]|uniref:NPC intracellular cholesterol transporter 1 n=1 Tax=Phytophthora pseudosyringae TaxID=221518 RepID=A0A8T1W076_9STRA|nr:NPC intracellular cholesterol transporter 1 [Phytophthora pseudosyringae]
MWLFAAISLAIATPCFRAWLEALFAELSIVFFTYLRLVSAGLAFVLLLALGFHGRRFLRSRRVAGRPTRPQEADEDAKTGLARVQWRRGTRRRALLLRAKSTTSEIAGSGFYPPQLWTSSLFALAMLPIINSVIVGGGGGGDQPSSSSFRALKSETAAATQTALDADAAALVMLRQQLATCKYSGGHDCLDNATSVSVLGDYRQETGRCAAFDAAYVNVTAGAALPAQYFPIAVEEAYAQGFANNFSAWSETNQDKFQTDCPLLYNETVVGEGETLLCCTETQYERLSLQVRELPGQCSSCKENLRNVWCQFTCHPSNSLFVDVTQVRLMEGDSDHADEVFPAIEEATYYVGSDMARDLHDFCEADTGFMPLVCGMNEDNCSTTGSDVLEYLGAYSFDGVGSPSQVNFRTTKQLSATEQAEKICACGSSNSTGCFSPMDTRLESCVDTCGSLCAASAHGSRQYEAACYNSSSSSVSDDLSTATSDSTVSTSSSDSSSAAGKLQLLLSDLSARAQTGSFAVLNYVLAVLAFFAATALALGFAYSTRYGKKKRQSILDDPINGPMGSSMLSLVNLDQLKGIGRWDDRLTQHLKRWGDFVAMGNHPLYIILLSLMLVVCCSSGLARMEVEADSMKLWVSEGSTVLQERTRFGEMLGPVARVERLVLVAKDGGAVTRSAYIKEAIRLQQIVAEDISSDSVKLSDICVKDASNSPCQVNAVTQYFQNSMDHFAVYETYGLVGKHLSNCANIPERDDVDGCSELKVQLNASGSSLPTSMSDCPCVSSFGAPMTELEKYLGGFTVDDDSVDASTYLEQATTLFTTAVVTNHQDITKNANAIAWERSFIERMEKEAEDNALYDIYYAAEASADDEFAVASNLDIVFKAGIAGFLFMFAYVVIGLNHWKLDHRFFHSSKIGVGFMGVACILMAVGCTLGIFAWTGVKLQIVTLVLLPLVMLAIGTGNIFLILHAVDLKQEELKMEQRSLFAGLEDNDFGIHEITCVLLCEATGHIGPSLILTVSCECCIVAFAAYSAMPAAQWLAGSLAVGLAASFALQMTLFLAIVALDKRRELSGTYDVICCKRASFARRPRLSEDENTNATENSSFPGSSYSLPDLNLMDRCVKGYVHVLLKKVSKVLVLLVFAACTLVAIVAIEAMDRGLSPTSFIPTDSYLHAYYRAVDENDLSRKEFPVYFVVESGYGSNPNGFNDLADDAAAQSKFCSSKEICDDLSIPNILSALVAYGESNVTYFKDGVVVGSWLDDFWGFVNPDSECCRVDPKNNYSYSPLRPEEISAAYILERASVAPSCLANASEVSSVPDESFMSLFSMFSMAGAGPLCTYAAGTRYHGQLSIDSQPIPATSSSASVLLNGTGYGNEVTAFAYKVLSTTADSSTISGSQEGAVTAYSQAQHIAKWISEETGIDVWVYSPEYVYLDQFHSIRRTTYIVVGAGLVVVFVLQSLALGSYGYGFAVTFIAAVTVVQVAGLMMPMGVPLNSLSSVSLSIAVTFSVGFAGHFARLFAKARTITDDSGIAPMGDACVKKALTQLLASWTLGVAVSKFVAIAALALVATPVFEPAGNCFFRTLMAAAVCSWLNGAVLLPVGLSIAVDATEGRVRDVKPTNEEGGEYSRESPMSSYHNAPPTGKY